MVAALAKRNPLSLKRHLFLHGDRAKMLAQGFLDLFFDAAPHLEDFFQFFELSTKAAFAKAAFDTLRSLIIFRPFFPSGPKWGPYRAFCRSREEHSMPESMDQCRSRLKLSENFQDLWSMRISGEVHMDQSLIHTTFPGEIRMDQWS